jgi:hypothetical protein
MLKSDSYKANRRQTASDYHPLKPPLARTSFAPMKTSGFVALGSGRCNLLINQHNSPNLDFFGFLFFNLDSVIVGGARSRFFGYLPYS